MKPKNRQLLLAILMVVLCLMVLRTYLPKISIPTATLVEEKKTELLKLQKELERVRYTRQVLQKAAKEYFWISSSPTERVDMAINKEFKKILDRSRLHPADEDAPKYTKEPNGSCLQEVIIPLKIEKITSRQLAFFLFKLRTSEKGKVFRWESCRITHDRKSPETINVSAELKVLVLNDNAKKYFGLEKGKIAENTPAPTQATPHSSKKK